MNRLYQWLGGGASLFRSNKSSRGLANAVRSEVTVQRESTTLLISGPTAAFDTCPLCGQDLAPEQAEQARLRLQKGSAVRNFD
jgi:hypothetical protein